MFTIVSYHAGPGYAEEATLLIKTLEQFDLAYEVEAVTDLGLWSYMTSHKPTFLLKKMEQIEGPVVWVDCDARIRQYPTLFDELTSDIDVAVAYRAGHELLSGTVWLSNTDSSKRLVSEWKELCDRRPEVWDQRHLSNIIRGYNHAILPEQYTWIRRFMEGKPVIEHTQASRRLKR